MGGLKPDLVIVGHIIKETIKFPDKVIEPVLGSPAAYSAVVAGRLGVKTGLVTKAGKDMPEELLRPFLDAGVDIRGMHIGEDTTTNLLIYDTSGKKTVKYLKKAPDIYFEDFPVDYISASLIYVCPMDYEVPLETIRSLRQTNAVLAVDLGGFGGATSDTHPSKSEKKDPKYLRELIGYFDVVKASIEDCRHLLRDVEGTEGEVARLFVEWGAHIGVITLGGRGAVVVTRECQFDVPAFQAKIVDCTGAGDSYSAGFLAEYLRTRDPERAGLFGSATASLVIEGTGGVLVERMPTTWQVEERIARVPVC